MPSQGKTSLQHPSSRLRFCPEDLVAWASSSLTLAPFCNKLAAEPGSQWLCCYSTSVTTGMLGRERSLREPQAKLLNLLWQDLSTKFWGRAGAYLQSKLWGHPGHMDAPPSTCASPHLAILYSLFANQVTSPSPPAGKLITPSFVPSWTSSTHSSITLQLILEDSFGGP